MSQDYFFLNIPEKLMLFFCPGKGQESTCNTFKIKQKIHEGYDQRVKFKILK